MNWNPFWQWLCTSSGQTMNGGVSWNEKGVILFRGSWYLSCHFGFFESLISNSQAEGLQRPSNNVLDHPVLYLLHIAVHRANKVNSIEGLYKGWVGLLLPVSTSRVGVLLAMWQAAWLYIFLLPNACLVSNWRHWTHNHARALHTKHECLKFLEKLLSWP